MTGDEIKVLLEIRDRTNRIEQRLEDRDRQCQVHSNQIILLDERVDTIEKHLTGLKSWIATAGLIGGIVGWISHQIIPFLGGK